MSPDSERGGPFRNARACRPPRVVSLHPERNLPRPEAPQWGTGDGRRENRSPVLRRTRLPSGCYGSSGPRFLPFSNQLSIRFTVRTTSEARKRTRPDSRWRRSAASRPATRRSSTRKGPSPSTSGQCSEATVPRTGSFIYLSRRAGSNSGLFAGFRASQEIPASGRRTTAPDGAQLDRIERGRPARAPSAGRSCP